MLNFEGQYGLRSLLVFLWQSCVRSYKLCPQRYRNLSFNKKTEKGEHRTSLTFLLNLAVSDLCVGITVILVKMMLYLCNCRVINYKGVTVIVYNVLIYFFLRFSLIISIFSLLALLFDRLLSIRNPFRYTIVQMKHIVVTIVIIWVLSIGTVTGFYYFSMHILSPRISRRYRCLIFPVTIIPAVTVFSLCYLFIFKAIQKQGKQFRNRIHPEIPDRSRKRSFEMHTLKRESRVARFVGLVVFTFMLCWFPLAVLGIVEANGTILPPTVGNPIFILAFSNSATNPLIYFGFKNRLRRNVNIRFVRPIQR